MIMYLRLHLFLYVLVVMFVAGGLMSACSKDKKPAATLPTVQVHLPPSPELKIPMVNNRHPDGSYTVEGLIRSRAKLINKDVRISGFIQRKYVCDPDQQVCETPSHAVLVDELEKSRKRLIVVGSRSTQFAALRTGEHVILDAHYALHDPRALFVRTEGVLVLPFQKEEATPSPSKGTE